MKWARNCGWIPVLILVFAWALASQTQWGVAHALPSPREVVITARQQLTTAALWLDLAATLARVLVGTGIAVTIGTAVGVGLATTTQTWRASEPTIEFLRSIPPILTYPLCLLSFGYGETARLVSIVFGTTGIVLIHVARALTTAPSARKEIVRTAGLRGFDAVRCLHAYELLPGLFTGTRLAITAALIISIVTEMLVGARYGLGCRAQSALLEYRADVLWLVILIAGFTSLGISVLLDRVERRVLDWREA